MSERAAHPRERAAHQVCGWLARLPAYFVRGSWAMLLTLTGCQCLTCEGAKYHEGPPAKEVHKDERRAGFPAEESHCAKPSDTGRYVGYYVGGGAGPCRCDGGDEPTADEGTWGWDYAGLCLPSWVRLGWWHGRRHQGGGGDYRTDGPRPLQKLEQSKEAPQSCGGD